MFQPSGMKLGFLAILEGAKGTVRSADFDVVICNFPKALMIGILPNNGFNADEEDQDRLEPGTEGV